LSVLAEIRVSFWLRILVRIVIFPEPAKMPPYGNKFDSHSGDWPPAKTGAGHPVVVATIRQETVTPAIGKLGGLLRIQTCRDPAD